MPNIFYGAWTFPGTIIDDRNQFSDGAGMQVGCFNVQSKIFWHHKNYKPYDPITLWPQVP